VIKINPSKNEINLGASENVSFVPMEAVGENGGLRLDQDGLLDEIGTGYTYFADNDVVVAKITPCFENGKGALAKGLTNQVAFGTTELHVLRGHKPLAPSYLFYLTMSHIFRKVGESEMYGAGGQKRIPENFIKDFRLALPPLPEQQAIARFLDVKTAALDGVRIEIEAAIAKLQEYRSALITHAVTGKINVQDVVLPESVPEEIEDKEVA
jgi:type I restriction enzyme S subunit